MDSNQILENKEMLPKGFGGVVWGFMWGRGDWCETHHLEHVCYSPNHIASQGHPKTSHFGHHGNGLHHSAPCCSSMCLTSAPARALSLSGSPPTTTTTTALASPTLRSERWWRGPVAGAHTANIRLPRQSPGNVRTARGAGLKFERW